MISNYMNTITRITKKFLKCIMVLFNIIYISFMSVALLSGSLFLALGLLCLDIFCVVLIYIISKKGDKTKIEYKPYFLNLYLCQLIKVMDGFTITKDL